MKKIITLLTLTALISVTYYCPAQCVIYKCYGNDGFGAMYNDGNPPYASYSELEMKAKSECEQYCSDCSLYFRGDYTGWWAIVIGNVWDGTPYLQAVYGYDSKLEAEDEVNSLYGAAGGQEAYKKVYSWYVPVSE